MMLGKPYRTVSEPVSQHDLVHALVERALDSRFGQIRGFQFEKETYVHARLSYRILQKKYYLIAPRHRADAPSVQRGIIPLGAAGLYPRFCSPVRETRRPADVAAGTDESEQTIVRGDETGELLPVPNTAGIDVDEVRTGIKSNATAAHRQRDHL